MFLTFPRDCGLHASHRSVDAAGMLTLAVVCGLTTGTLVVAFTLAGML